MARILFLAEHWLKLLFEVYMERTNVICVQLQAANILTSMQAPKRDETLLTPRLDNQPNCKIW